MSENAGALLGQAIAGLIRDTFLLVRWMLRLNPRARAMREARAGERASRRRQQQWLDDVRRQKARGEAGDATQADARAALRGRGGRRSALDDRYF
jgi:hypothetical protein